MRSVDLFLGLPFDIASFALLQILIANDTGLSASRLLFSLGDAHIYSNHIDQVKTVLTRSPLEPPTLLVDTNASINNFTTSMASMLDYRSLGTVPATLNT
jgi:thymidylate synthase